MKNTWKASTADFTKILNAALSSPPQTYTPGTPNSYSFGGVKASKRGLNKTKGGKPIVYLIDADTYAYRAAAATDGRYYETEDGKTFKYKRDADIHIVDYSLSGSPVLNFDPEPEAVAIKNLRAALNQFSGRACEYFITGKSNFRYSIVSNYKGNRGGGRVPQHLKACKQLLLDEYKATLDPNLEADDLVIIRAKQLERAGIPWVIVGCDKDLKQIPGSFLDPFTGKREVVDAATARKNLWRQIATGDSTDNIKSPKGIGPVAFAKYFKSVDWDKAKDFDLLCLMVGLYKTKVTPLENEPEDLYTVRVLRWIKTVASLVFLRRHYDEEYQLPTKDSSPDRSKRETDLKYCKWHD